MKTQPEPLSNPSVRLTLTHQALRAWSPLSRTAGEGAERSEAGEGSHCLTTSPFFASTDCSALGSTHQVSIPTAYLGATAGRRNLSQTATRNADKWKCGTT